MRITLLLLLPVLLAVLFVEQGCSDTTLKPPASDKNFDEEDPTMTMMGVVPDAATDGLPDGQGKSCTTKTDCSAPLRCIFPIALGCGAPGMCVLFTDPPNCAAQKACACKGVDVDLCAPDGFAQAPIKHAGVCSASSDASSE